MSQIQAKSKSVQGMNLITDFKPEGRHHTNSDGEESPENDDTFEPLLNLNNGQKISIAALKSEDIAEGLYELINDVNPQTLESLKLAQDSTGE